MRRCRGSRFTVNPLFGEVANELASTDGELNMQSRLQLRQKINDLNTIGHVFTRTRRREIAEEFRVRHALTVTV